MCDSLALSSTSKQSALIFTGTTQANLIAVRKGGLPQLKIRLAQG